MKRRRFVQCDVFTGTPTLGNALAVVIDADGLTDQQMHRFARWTNLAETTFLLPPTHPDADYAVRILTPNREMPFAGHPTLGSCASWLHCGGQSKQNGLVRQECGIGLVEIDISLAIPAFIAPPTKIESLAPTDAARIMSKLEIDPLTVTNTAKLDNGPVWQVFEMKSADDVLAVDSTKVRWPDEKAIGLIGPHQQGSASGCDYEVRMLAPSSGMTEDPITGSLNSALAHWMRNRGVLERAVTVAQGTNIGREGRVTLTPLEHDILIGGETHILIDGSVAL